MLFRLTSLPSELALYVRVTETLQKAEEFKEGEASEPENESAAPQTVRSF
jgi:hypothetical protein